MEFQRPIEQLPNLPGKLLVLTGPTAAGKTELLTKMVESNLGFNKIVTTTTRNPREGEEHGKDYYFMPREDFLDGLSNNLFLEHAEYAGNYYGTAKAEIEKVLQGKNMVLAMEMSGAVNIEQKILNEYEDTMAQNLINNTKVVFIGVSSLVTLKDRYAKRGDNKDKLHGRLKRDWQMWNEYQDRFDHLIVNHDGALDSAYRQLVELVEASKNL